MLGEVTPSPPNDALPTNTRVPLPERARPISITPPPVVDAGREEPRPAPKRGRVAAFGVAGLVALVIGAVSATRAFAPSRPVAAQAAASPSSAPVLPATLVAPAAPPTAAEMALAPEPAPAASVTAAAAPPSEPSSLPAVASSDAPVSDVISDGKRLSSHALLTRLPATSTPVGVFQHAPPARRPSAPRVEPAMPASGL